VAIRQDCRKTLEVGGLGRKKMRARLILRYHECAEPREAREKIKSNKTCIEHTLEASEAQEATSARALATFRSSPDADRQSSFAMRHKFEFFIRKVVSNLTMQKFPEKVSAWILHSINFYRKICGQSWPGFLRFPVNTWDALA